MATYQGKNTQRISFPLGGLGSGCIGLGGNGRLIDWEIFNRPFKWSANGFTHMLVRAEQDGQVVDTRVLQGDYLGDATGGETVNINRGNGGYGFGMGPYRGTLAGVPHFEKYSFTGEFPFAQLDFADSCFPGKVSLMAFNPFIPLNDKDSSLPAAFFEITFTNDTEKKVDYTACFSMNNILPYATTVNRYEKQEGVHTISMSSNALQSDDLLYGNLCVATDAEDVSHQEYWYRADWFDSLQSYWNDLQKGGKLKNRSYDGDKRRHSSTLQHDGDDMATLACHLSLAPGESRTVRYVVSWFFPNCVNYWNPDPAVEVQEQWHNYYATLTKSAQDCAGYALRNWQRLYDDTKCFKDILFATTLPDSCIEAVSANLSILKSATCMRLEDGSFYGFEGCNPDSGCCEGSCSHVWNYAYALPYLFPALERSMRDLDFRYNQREDGAVSFRMMMPLGRARYDFRPCVDGQMGGVIKTYRDYKLCGNLEWLRGKWEGVKKSIEFAWSPTNPDRWDANMDGVMEGRQHHTLDMELFGPSSWLNGFYQAALKAGAEIATLLGHTEEAALYERLFSQGKAWADENLFNGDYYQQQIALDSKAILEQYNEGVSLTGSDAVGSYWNEETGEIKYQIANGSCIDQVIGQWHANLCGLGEVFDRKQVRQALKSIYNINYRESVRSVFNPARLYAYNDDGGVLICDWPEGMRQPTIPITYAKEVFCGMEYQVASHMLQEGLVEEGLDIIRTIRKRFDGEKRNPWNEFECGSNYARSMASYAILPSVSGFEVDLGCGHIGFSPKLQGSFSSFWSVDGGWGNFVAEKDSYTLKLAYGAVQLQSLGLPISGAVRVTLGDKQLSCVNQDGRICFAAPLNLTVGSILTVKAV